MKLVLGTVQFGLDYGITNTVGQPDHSNCSEILRVAKTAGITTLDTAAAYGDSEVRLGQLKLSQEFSIISKVPSLAEDDPEMIIQLVKKSLSRLQRTTLAGILLHDENDLLGLSGEHYFEKLVALKSKGLIDKIGVSFYTAEAAEVILNRFDIDLIQIPANILDRRFEFSGILALAKSKNIEVHARSLFLQGLLAGAAYDRPKEFRNIKELNVFDSLVNELGISPLQLALAYLIKTPDINYAVVGCVSAEQLRQIVEAYEDCLLMEIELPDISTNNLSLINPSNW